MKGTWQSDSSGGGGWPLAVLAGLGLSMLAGRTHPEAATPAPAPAPEVAHHPGVHWLAWALAFAGVVVVLVAVLAVGDWLLRRHRARPVRQAPPAADPAPVPVPVTEADVLARYEAEMSDTA